MASQQETLPPPSRLQLLSRRLSGSLSPEAKQFYENNIPQDLRSGFEEGLDRIKRGAFFLSEGFPNAEEFQETDLEHIVAGEETIKIHMETYPILRSYINPTETQLIYGVHDCGEIHPSIGDVQPFNRTGRDERRKRLEPFAARTLMLRIPNPRAQEEIRLMYDRFIENHPRDLEVQLARYIDKAQGTVDPAGLVFKMEGATDEQKKKITQHMWHMIPRMVEPALNLLTYLPTEEAREAVRRIVLEDLSQLKQHGPEEVLETFEKGFSPAA